jgi:hypothetical protein
MALLMGKSCINGFHCHVWSYRGYNMGAWHPGPRGTSCGYQRHASAQRLTHYWSFMIPHDWPNSIMIMIGSTIRLTWLFFPVCSKLTGSQSDLRISEIAAQSPAHLEDQESWARHDPLRQNPCTGRKVRNSENQIHRFLKWGYLQMNVSTNENGVIKTADSLLAIGVESSWQSCRRQVYLCSPSKMTTG